MQEYKTPLFRMSAGKNWIVHEYPGEFLDLKNAYTFALLTLSPVEISGANIDQDMPYGFTIGSYAFDKIKEGVFDEKLAPFPTMANLKVKKSQTLTISGLKARWEEAEITMPGIRNFNMRLSIPLEMGYIEIDAWGPFDDEKLVEDFRSMASSIVVTSKNHFKDNPEIFKKGQP
jgi:hypothetical protein